MSKSVVGEDFHFWGRCELYNEKHDNETFRKLCYHIQRGNLEKAKELFNQSVTKNYRYGFATGCKAGAADMTNYLGIPEENHALYYAWESMCKCIEKAKGEVIPGDYKRPELFRKRAIERDVTILGVKVVDFYRVGMGDYCYKTVFESEDGVRVVVNIYEMDKYEKMLREMKSSGNTGALVLHLSGEDDDHGFVYFKKLTPNENK